MHPIDILEATTQSHAIAACLPDLHDHNIAEGAIRQALSGLHTTYNAQPAQNFTPDQHMLILAYHKMAISLFKLYKICKNAPN